MSLAGRPREERQLPAAGEPRARAAVSKAWQAPEPCALIRVAPKALSTGLRPRGPDAGVVGADPPIVMVLYSRLGAGWSSHGVSVGPG